MLAKATAGVAAALLALNAASQVPGVNVNGTNDDIPKFQGDCISSKIQYSESWWDNAMVGHATLAEQLSTLLNARLGSSLNVRIFGPFFLIK